MWWIGFIGRQVYAFVEADSAPAARTNACAKYAGMVKVYGPYRTKVEAREATPAVVRDYLRSFPTEYV